ncbi:MAG: MFS transporter [Anaerolineaceae bacterium]|nr:MFS transporter [Anaerolineaceae bacterium]
MPRKNLTTFFILLVTQTISLIGSRMTSMAMGIWIFTETGKAAPLLLASFFAELPGMLVGSLAGVLVDRWPRKTVMILSDAGQALGSLLLLLSFSSGQFQLWHLYVVSLMQGLFATFQGPARDATTTLLIPAEKRERLNAVIELSFPLAGTIAPVLAGLLFSLVGVSGVILIDLGTFLLAVLVVAFQTIPQPPTSEEGAEGRGRFLAEALVGLRFFLKRRALFLFLLYLVFVNFLLNGPLSLDVPYLIAVTGSEQTMGWVVGLMSLGAFSGALLISFWGGTRPRIYTILGGLALSGVMYLICGTARSVPVLGAAFFLVMVPLPINNALIVSILQLKTPPDLQGRVFAFYGQASFLGSTLSFALTGWLVDHWLEPAIGGPGWERVAWLVGDSAGAGMGLVLVAAGLLMLASTLLIWAQRSIRRLEVDLPDLND